MREVIQSIKLIIIEVPPFRVKLKYGVGQNNFILKVFTSSLGLRPETFDYDKRKIAHPKKEKHCQGSVGIIEHQIYQLRH